MKQKIKIVFECETELNQREIAKWNKKSRTEQIMSLDSAEKDVETMLIERFIEFKPTRMDIEVTTDE